MRRELYLNQCNGGKRMSYEFSHNYFIYYKHFSFITFYTIVDQERCRGKSHFI